MRFIAFLALLALAKANIDSQNECGGISIGSINYKIQMLKDNIDRPYKLAIDQETNTLFFSYSAPPPNDTDYIAAYLNLKTNEFGLVTGLPEGFTNAVNNKNHIVYIGGENGIYKYDYTSKTANRIDLTTEYISDMFYKDGLYYTTYPSLKAYLYEDGEVKVVPELINAAAESIAVDKNNNIYFSNSSGLFAYKRADGSFQELGNYAVIGFTADVHGNVYFVTTSGVYIISAKPPSVRQIIHIENTFGVAIEDDGSYTGSFIYATDNSIVRLKYTGMPCREIFNKDD